MDFGAVRFITTPDGNSIAYRSLGAGPPLVAIHNFTVSHIQLEPEVPSFRAGLESLAEHHQVIRLDPRGTGLSSELTSGPSVDEVASDVVAVADALDIDRFSLLATGTMAPVGIRLGANPRVDRLILNEPEIDVLGNAKLAAAMRAGDAMREAGVGEHIADLWIAGADPADAVSFRALIEANIRGKTGQLNQTLPWDGSPWLAEVTAPTLILYTRDGDCGPQAQAAAAAIPQAQLVVLSGTAWRPDPTEERSALGGFLGWAPEASAANSPATSTIVFTDVVASTELVNLHGDDAARALIREAEQVVAIAAAAHGGRVIKQLGDGSLLEFATASSAVEFARRAQADTAMLETALRIGMAAGEPIREDGDVHGAVVVVASRVTDFAGAGDTLVSDGVRQLLVGKQHEFEDLGDHTLKGFDEPVRVWRLAD